MGWKTSDFGRQTISRGTFSHVQSLGLKKTLTEAREAARLFASKGNIRGAMDRRPKLLHQVKDLHGLARLPDSFPASPAFRGNQGIKESGLPQKACVYCKCPQTCRRTASGVVLPQPAWFIYLLTQLSKLLGGKQAAWRKKTKPCILSWPPIRPKRRRLLPVAAFGAGAERGIARDDVHQPPARPGDSTRFGGASFELL